MYDRTHRADSGRPRGDVNARQQLWGGCRVQAHSALGDIGIGVQLFILLSNERLSRASNYRCTWILEIFIPAPARVLCQAQLLFPRGSSRRCVQSTSLFTYYVRRRDAAAGHGQRSSSRKDSIDILVQFQWGIAETESTTIKIPHSLSVC